MKVRVSYTVEVDDDYRKAVNAYYGLPGKASSEELKSWFRCHGQTMNDEVIWEYQQKLQDSESVRYVYPGTQG